MEFDLTAASAVSKNRSMSSLGKRSHSVGRSIGERFKMARRQEQRVRSKSVAPSRRVEAAVKKVMERETEQKFVDVPFQENPIIIATNVNTNIKFLNPIQQGAGQNNRVGNKVRLHSVRVRMNILNSYQTVLPGNFQGDNFVRIVLFWDKEGGPRAPFNDVFAQVTQDDTVQTDMFSLVYPPNNGRYRILRDELINFNMDPANPIEDSNPAVGTPSTYTMGLQQKTKFLDWYVPLKNEMFTTRWNGTVNPITENSVISGCLYLASIANTEIVSLGQAQILSASARVRFTDV